jgi:hypothetical protein
MRKLLVAALMVMLASPAFAAIQNVKVSGDITSTFVDRSNFDLGLNNGDLGVNVNGSPTQNGTDPIGLKKTERFHYPNPPSCGR